MEKQQQNSSRHDAVSIIGVCDVVMKGLDLFTTALAA